MAPDDRLASEMPEAVVAKRRRVSIIWLIPVVAAIIGIWLAYKTITEQGPHVTVTFETAEGLEAGKTKVKYRDVEVGLVDGIELAKEGAFVAVGIRMKNKGAAAYLTKTARFWVVRARLDASGVSGLGTILSGAYIEVEPGAQGEPRQREFVGLETAPVVRVDTPGRRYVLKTDRLGSLSARTPIYYRGIRVGELLGYELTDDQTTIRVHAFVKAPYDHLVLESTHFWNVSGLEVEAGTDGLKVRMESLQALLTGGVTFDFEPDLPGGTAAPEGKEFPLYANREAIREAAIVEQVPYVLYFDGSVRGLAPGAPVEFRGVRIGTVKAIQPQVNLRQSTVRIAVFIAIEPERLAGEAEVIGNPQERRKYAVIGDMVEKGLRAQMQTASLITGQQLVALDFFPTEPPKKLNLDGKVPEIPTVPSTFTEIANSAGRFLNKLSELPLDAMVGDIRSMIGTLDATLVETKTLAQTARGELRPTLAKFREAADAAKGALVGAETTLSSVNESIGENSEVRESLATTLRELGAAARSIRDLADYLERHPEALVKGKAGDAR